MELELKHISPYLPYRLMMEYKLKTVELLGVKNRTPWSHQLSVEFEKGLWTYGYEVQLILHPLSDLTKEIKHNGVKFNPMMELAKIAFPRRKPFEDFSLFDDYIKLDNWNVQGYSFHFDKIDTSFDCRVDYDGKKWRSNCFVPNQLDLFQKLFEWHFDVFGLIENNLAIDINTLTK